MPREIRFTGERTRNFEMGGISFRATVDGESCACVITDEALQDHFGAKRGTPARAFDSNRTQIEGIARAMIECGHARTDGKIVITSDDVR